MSDLKMKIINNSEIKLKMKSSDNISMKFDDYQKFKEEDPIFKDSPAYKITNEDIYNWNHKSNFSGNYNDLTNKPNLNQYATIDFVDSRLSNKVDKVVGMGLSQNSFTTEEKNKLASLENYDDTTIVNELNNKANISDIPTSTNELTNDSGFITNTVDDLVNYPTTNDVNGLVAQKQNIIDSENMLSADYVDDTSTTNKFVTATDITNWNNKSDFSGSYNDLTDKPTIPILDNSVSTSSTNGVENQAITNYVNTYISDTGWVDLSSYVNTTNFSARSGFKPMARRIGKTVYLKGAVYCSTAPNSNKGNILTNIPSQFRPPEEIAGAGARYGTTTPFRIWYESGNISIQEANNIPTTQDYQGYALSSLGCYLVD